MFKNNPFFIAEISANHCGSIHIAKKLILDAKKYGADAVKLQTYTADTMTLNIKKKDFMISNGIWKGKGLWELYNKAHTPYIWHKELFNYAKKLKIRCFSTPFDETAVDFLEKLNCPFYKISSFEMTDLPLIKKVAQTKKKIIISTGLADINEIEQAYNTAKKFGSSEITLLYCVSKYPSNTEDFNLNNIRILIEKFGCKVGLSDHSIGSDIASKAILAGASVVEKHIASKNHPEGLDYEFSLKGKEILEFRKAINDSAKILGKTYFFRTNKEKINLKFRRSIYSINSIKKGEKFTSKNIKKIRPGFGLEPKYYEKLIGKKSPIDLDIGTPLKNKILKKLRITIKS